MKHYIKAIFLCLKFSGRSSRLGSVTSWKNRRVKKL